MTNSPDPSVHRQREQQFIHHVEKLLVDDRLRVDTTRGRRPLTTLIRDITRGDRGVELKRLMSEMNKPDRELQNKMPVGESVEVVLSQTRWFFFKAPVGRVRAMCVSPSKALVAGEEPRPMTRAEIADVLRQTPPPLANVPSTLIVMSTVGFTIEAHEAAERRADRTVVLVEPNDAGGWSVVGPAETKALADLFDPEPDAEKRRRVREAIDEGRVDLLSAGVATDKVAARTRLPAPFVEAELKAYAKETPGLVAKRLDGKVVLFRQTAVAAPDGGGDMPLIDRMKALFSRKGDTEKKIAFLAERRAALSQQRDQGYEEMNDLESRESELRQQFKEATGDIVKRRVTSQLLQLRKDIERRQQLLSVLNQQVNVVATHLHNLELVQQGSAARLPDSEEMASDAAAAEEVMAELQANNELAESVGGSVHGGMSAEEQALFEELERGNQAEEKAEATPAESEKAEPEKRSEPAKPVRNEPTRTAAAPVEKPERRATPEAG